MTHLDIIIPAHNEQDRIDATLAAYRAVCPPTTGFVVALDDCTDRTAEVVNRHTREDTRVRALCLPRLGKGGAIMEAFRTSDADLVAFVDADGATPPSELLRLADVIDEQPVDGAIAARWHPSAVIPGRRRRPLLRRLASRAFALAVRATFRLPFSDTQCGAKVLRREVAERLVPLLSSRDFLFDVDLLVTARALGFTIAEVPTVWVDREGSRLQPVHDGKRMAASLLRLWLHHRVLRVQPPAAYPDEPSRPAPPGSTPAVDSDDTERADVR